MLRSRYITPLVDGLAACAQGQRPGPARAHSLTLNCGICTHMPSSYTYMRSDSLRRSGDKYLGSEERIASFDAEIMAT